ncbi:DUF1194 domain-containing protein [Pseudaminobacter soli (ex Li et al. 2025)]|uniref:VWFA domain-containing protein n=1 Tax=Pseudaminobacter soli (ex Li et al. 2025) TaxID=1295366 RepID=A0A2P7S5U0_9HYPH|nr:DUF1194 domain-containing protein [Mesorhizobium soli]PSJ57819.1 hypothetical protein C7I85_20805 [Mesorhizobium soli]
MTLSPDVAFAVEDDAVDTAVIFAVDKSSSIGPGTAQLQLNGHVEALRSAEVAKAIASGAIGCVAISYVEWSSVGKLDVILPWTRLCGAEDASNAAGRILERGSDGIERRGGGRTSLSFAIDAGRLLLGRYPGHAGRKVIDVSTNGTNNDGLSVSDSRARAFEVGYIVNGIAVSRDEPGITDDLPGYLEHNVITGAGAFVVAPSKPEEYAMALRRKLVLEISDSQTGGAAGAQYASNSVR